MYWDRNGDGMVTPADVWTGFRDLGFTVPICLLACTLIPLNFSYPTRLVYSYWPDPMFRIYVGGIYKAKVCLSSYYGIVAQGTHNSDPPQHGSDSGVFDNEGRFVPQKFDDMFAACDKRGDATLTLGELFDLMQRNRVAGDIFGSVAAWFEWVTTWLLLQRQGNVHKEDVRKVYDVSVYPFNTDIPVARRVALLQAFSAVSANLDVLTGFTLLHHPRGAADEQG